MNAPIEGSLIDRIVVVDRITRRRNHTFHDTSSLPGHTLQLTVEGTAHHEFEGRVFQAEPGLLAWFCRDEEVRIRITRAPWSFLTVNFIAPHLPPPPPDQSLRRAVPGTQRLFENLLQAWRDNPAQPLVRHLRSQARLLDLIAGILPSGSTPFRLDPVAQLWWGLEAALRGRLQERIHLEFLRRFSGRSTRTLYEACHRATGMAPLKRIKKIRLSMARGLVLHSPLSISEVAYRVGYDRVQELCRDYHQHIGLTPTQDRTAGPDYRRARLRYQH